MAATSATHGRQRSRTLLSEAIHTERLLRGWTQEQLRRHFKVRRQTISAWENGSCPALLYFEAIARFLGLPNRRAVAALVVPISDDAPLAAFDVTGEANSPLEILMKNLGAKIREDPELRQLVLELMAWLANQSATQPRGTVDEAP